MQIGTRHSLLHKFATSRSFTPLSGPIFLTLEEVVERYRGQVSAGTLRNWRSMRIGPSFIKIGKPFSIRWRSSIAGIAVT
jgi:hypothetical protein